MTTNATQLDSFLYGMALANRAQFRYLNSNDHSVAVYGENDLTYVEGMGERLAALMLKIVTAVAFILISLGLIAHYLFSYIGQVEEAVRTQRQVRLKVGLLVFGRMHSRYPYRYDGHFVSATSL